MTNPKITPLPLFQTVEDKERKPKEYKKVKPVYLLKLKELVGTCTACAELIGVADSTVSMSIKADEVSMPMELAAQYIYNERTKAKQGKTEGAFVIASKDVLDVMKPWVEQNGGTLYFAKDCKEGD